MDPQTPNFNETVPTPPSPVPELPKKDPHGITIAAMAAFVLLSLGAIVFLYNQNQTLKTLLAGYQTPAPTATATPDPTANWEIYTSPKKDYSFKHPSELKSDIEAAGTGFESIRFTYIGPDQKASGKTQTELFDGYSFTVTKLGASLDAKTEVDKAALNAKDNCTSVSGVAEVLVSGIGAYQYSGNCLGTYTTTYVSGNKNLYSITQHYTNDAYQKTTDLILSTLKFISPTSSPSASPVACTLEAKICPDGTSVGRTGPNCEFAPCP